MCKTTQEAQEGKEPGACGDRAEAARAGAGPGGAGPAGLPRCAPRGTPRSLRCWPPAPPRPLAGTLAFRGRGNTAPDHDHPASPPPTCVLVHPVGTQVLRPPASRTPPLPPLCRASGTGAARCGGGGSPPHPQDVALPAAGCSLVPLAALCFCLGFRTSPLGAGPGGRALSGTWHLPVAAHLLPQLSTPSASSPQLVSLLLLRGSHRTCSGLAGQHGPESAPPPTTGDAPNCLPAGSWSPSSPFGFLYTQRPLAAPGSSRCSRPRPLSAGP